MKISSNDYIKYIESPKSFYDLLNAHDSVIESIKCSKKYFEVEINAHEWKNSNYLLKFLNPRNFYIKKENSTNLFIDHKELIGLKINDCILDFNLIKFNNQIYFIFLLNEYMHSLLFQADELEIIKL